MPHQVLVGVAEYVVVLGAVLREVELRLLKDADQVGEAIHHRLSLAQLVRVVEIGEVAAGEAGGGHVHLLPFERDALARLGRYLQQQRP